MAANGKGCNWSVEGPRALAWMRAEVPKRSTIVGIHEACVRALRLPVDRGRLGDYLSETRRAEWTQIKLTLGTGTGNGTGPHAPTGTGTSSSPVPTRTLAEFLRDKRRAGCPVCALSPEILQCLAEAANKGSAKVPEQVEWLNTDCGTRITVQELTQHRSGHHES